MGGGRRTCVVLPIRFLALVVFSLFFFFPTERFSRDVPDEDEDGVLFFRRRSTWWWRVGVVMVSPLPCCGITIRSAWPPIRPGRRHRLRLGRLRVPSALRPHAALSHQGACVRCGMYVRALYINGGAGMYAPAKNTGAICSGNRQPAVTTPHTINITLW